MRADKPCYATPLGSSGPVRDAVGALPGKAIRIFSSDVRKIM
jgi:hypothetical protein